MGQNERAGRGPFATKAKAYANSALEITKTIPTYGPWTAATIEQRAGWLANAALDAFPLIASSNR